MMKVFSNESDPQYFAKDIEFARQYSVSRHTIYFIRDQLKVPPRSDRIYARLKKINLKQFTIKQLASMLNLRYQNLYKILKEHNLTTKPDTSMQVPEKSHRKKL